MGDQSSDDLGLESPTFDRTGPSLLAPLGRLTTDDAVALREAALQLTAAGQTITIDCSDLEDVGGACLQVLLALAVDLRARSARVLLSNLPHAVMRTLSLSGATVYLDVA